MILREIWDIFFEFFIFHLFARVSNKKENKKREKYIPYFSKNHALTGLSHGNMYTEYILMSLVEMHSNLILRMYLYYYVLASYKYIIARTTKSVIIVKLNNTSFIII